MEINSNKEHREVRDVGDLITEELVESEKILNEIVAEVGGLVDTVALCRTYSERLSVLLGCPVDSVFIRNLLAVLSKTPRVIKTKEDLTPEEVEQVEEIFYNVAGEVFSRQLDRDRVCEKVEKRVLKKLGDNLGIESITTFIDSFFPEDPQKNA